MLFVERVTGCTAALPGCLLFQASTLLFVHVLIAFLVKNVVLVRALHKMIAPSRVDVQLGESGS